LDVGREMGRGGDGETREEGVEGEMVNPPLCAGTSAPSGSGVSEASPLGRYPKGETRRQGDKEKDL